jgi:glycosyltransferase involved in cell wall biosynthesis
MSDSAVTEPSPLVDVGIPTRDRPELVRLAIESVLAQTLTNWRLVVSENGPGLEETAATVRPYLTDERITHVITRADIGGAENWTRLIEEGGAPYVALLHDDDLWDPPFLERRVAFLDEHPECGFVFSGNREIDADGSTIRLAEFVLPEGTYSPEQLFPILYEHNVIGPPSIMVRRSAYEAVGPYFDPSFFPYWDYEMWLRLAAKFHAGYLSVRDCSYRMHDVKMTFTVRHFGEAYLQTIDRSDELLLEYPNLRVEPRIRHRRRAAALLTSALDSFEANERSAAIARLREAVRLYPRIVLDPRFGASLIVFVTGRRGARSLARARYFVHHQGIRLHRRFRPKA